MLCPAHAPAAQEREPSKAKVSHCTLRPLPFVSGEGEGWGGVSPSHVNPKRPKIRATATIAAMRVLLQQPPSGNEAPRYVQLTLVPDLLGGWELQRESGQIGGRVQLRRELFLQQQKAQQAFEKGRDAQIKRGFQVMFTSGLQQP